MENRILDLKEIAERIMFGQVKENTFFGWELRKGKTTEDINKAVKKGLNPKVSFNKTEMEIDSVALYLKDVLKRKKTNKVETIHRHIQINQ